MANHTINASNSYYGPPLALEDNAGGTLTVKADGYLIAVGGTEAAIGSVNLGGNWTVSIFGAIGVYGVDGSAALVLTSGGLTTASNVTVGPEGSIFAPGGYGLYAYHRTNVLNQGSISGATAVTFASTATGNSKLTNRGE